MEVIFPKDKKMQALYEKVVTALGPLPAHERRSGITYFEDLCESIIGQQLSIKAADTIIARVKAALPKQGFTPEGVLAADTETLRACGMSYSKIQYIKNIATAWQNNEIEHDKFAELDNETIITELTRIKGIGRWTAEMFLMFTLGREDVFSYGDLGLKNAINKIYKLSDKYSKVEVEKLTAKWAPNRTIACRVLWRSLQLK